VTGALAASSPDLEHLFVSPDRAGASSSRVIASRAGTEVAVLRRRSSSSSGVSLSASFFTAASWTAVVACPRHDYVIATTIVLDSGMLL